MGEGDLHPQLLRLPREPLELPRPGLGRGSLAHDPHLGGGPVAHRGDGRLQGSTPGLQSLHRRAEPVAAGTQVGDGTAEPGPDGGQAAVGRQCLQQPGRQRLPVQAELLRRGGSGLDRRGRDPAPHEPLRPVHGDLADLGRRVPLPRVRLGAAGPLLGLRRLPLEPGEGLVVLRCGEEAGDGIGRGKPLLLGDGAEQEAQRVQMLGLEPGRHESIGPCQQGLPLGEGGIRGGQALLGARRAALGLGGAVRPQPVGMSSRCTLPLCLMRTAAGSPAEAWHG